MTSSYHFMEIISYYYLSSNRKHNIIIFLPIRTSPADVMMEYSSTFIVPKLIMMAVSEGFRYPNAVVSSSSRGMVRSTWGRVSAERMLGSTKICSVQDATFTVAKNRPTCV